MNAKRKRYSAPEKAKIALEAIKSELSMAEIVSKYGVHATQVNAWKRKALEHLPEAFSEKDAQIRTDYESKLTELYEQIGRLEVENDMESKNLLEFFIAEMVALKASF